MRRRRVCVCVTLHVSFFVSSPLPSPRSRPLSPLSSSYLYLFTSLFTTISRTRTTDTMVCLLHPGHAVSKSTVLWRRGSPLRCAAQAHSQGSITNHLTAAHCHTRLLMCSTAPFCMCMCPCVSVCISVSLCLCVFVAGLWRQCQVVAAGSPDDEADHHGGCGRDEGKASGFPDERAHLW